MSKAYDMVEWDVLQAILQAHGFSDACCKLIIGCISSAHYSVLVNGSPYGFFPGSRGIRQGDPLSPTLFSFLADILSRLLSKAELEGKISGVKVTRYSPRITHLMYADDLLIYCRTNPNEALAVKECLDTYYSWTGQRINWEKSDIHFSANVPRVDRAAICRLLHMRECSHSSKYLGIPFCNFSKKSTAFNHIADKIAARLAGWKHKHLSLAGWATLIRSVAMATPSFSM